MYMDLQLKNQDSYGWYKVTRIHWIDEIEILGALKNAGEFLLRKIGVVTPDTSKW